MNRRKLLRRLLQGATHNVSFGDFTALLEGFGFALARVTGSHRIFVHAALSELVTGQSVKGEVKPYPIRQLLRLVERYTLRLED